MYNVHVFQLTVDNVGIISTAYISLSLEGKTRFLEDKIFVIDKFASISKLSTCKLLCSNCVINKYDVLRRSYLSNAVLERLYISSCIS